MAKTTKDTPAIVKELRNQEKQGALKTTTTNQQILEQVPSETDSMTMVAPESDNPTCLEKTTNQNKHSLINAKCGDLLQQHVVVHIVEELLKISFKYER